MPVDSAGGGPRAVLAAGRDAHEQIQSARRLPPPVRSAASTISSSSVHFYYGYCSRMYCTHKLCTRSISRLKAVVVFVCCASRWVKTVADRDQERAEGAKGRRLLGQPADAEYVEAEEGGAFAKARRSIPAYMCGCLLGVVNHCEAEIGLDNNPHAADQERQEHERVEAFERRAAAVGAEVAARIRRDDEEEAALNATRDADDEFDEGAGSSSKPKRDMLIHQPLLDSEWIE